MGTGKRKWKQTSCLTFFTKEGRVDDETCHGAFEICYEKMSDTDVSCPIEQGCSLRGNENGLLKS